MELLSTPLTLLSRGNHLVLGMIVTALTNTPSTLNKTTLPETVFLLTAPQSFLVAATSLLPTALSLSLPVTVMIG